MPQPTYLTTPVKDWETSNYPDGSPLWDGLWTDLQKQKRKDKAVLTPHLHPREREHNKFYAWHFPAEHYHPKEANIEGHQLFLEILGDDKIHLRMVHRQSQGTDKILDTKLIEKISNHLGQMLERSDIKLTLHNETVKQKYHSFGTFGENSEWRLCHPNGLLNFSATVDSLAKIRDFFEQFIESLKNLY